MYIINYSLYQHFVRYTYFVDQKLELQFDMRRTTFNNNIKYNI